MNITALSSKNGCGVEIPTYTLDKNLKPLSFPSRSMHMKELQEKLQFLTKDTVARDLTTLMRLSMANVLKLKSFKPGEIIVKELDLLTEFFFVKRGSCSVFKTLPDGKTLVKMGALAIGEHFGEVLVHRNPSQAKSEYCPVTIKADGEVEIGCLTAADAWTKMSRELEIGPFFKIEKETVEELHAEFIRKRDWTHNKNKMVDALLRERFRNPLITAKKYRTTQNFSMLTDIRPLM